MIILLSPAKSMEIERGLIKDSTLPRSLDKAEPILKSLKSKSISSIKKMMTMSDSIAQRTHEEYQDLDNEHASDKRGCAVLTYTGAAFLGLDARSFTSSQLFYAQKGLRILSGLYGVLRPLDLIQKYRLEMQAKIKISRKNLYAYWKSPITAMVNEDIRQTKSQYIINLLSSEYEKVLIKNELQVPMINFQFKVMKDGKLKFLSYDAKRARGLMCRYILVNKIQDIQSIKNFDVEGYRFNEKLSTDMNLTFIKQS